MTSSIERAAAYRTIPSTQTSASCTSSSAVLTVPSGFLDHFVRLQASGATIHLLAGSSTGITATTSHMFLTDGDAEDFYFRSDDTHLAHRTASGSGTLILSITDPTG